MSKLPVYVVTNIEKNYNCPYDLKSGWKLCYLNILKTFLYYLNTFLLSNLKVHILLLSNYMLTFLSNLFNYLTEDVL